MIGKEINLLAKYPKTKRDVSKRGEEKTEEHRKIARQFEKEFFDGDRNVGYGGFSYNPKFWTDVVKDMANFYKLKSGDKILDIGCAKGFMLYDFIKLNAKFDVTGIDISKYAIDNCIEELKGKLKTCNALSLPFPDNYFDLVISINTHHNLEGEEIIKAFKEMQRVTKKNSYVILDAYSNEREKEELMKWNLTAKTIKHIDDWKIFFKKIDYKGDYYWFKPL
jgi:ubiquinone/menaquinone biosynthesis C-methylase UbiE|tara:strand:- start:62 stop:727 length:666 start_codon:yes stop_codon:yes gene_type:complete